MAFPVSNIIGLLRLIGSVCAVAWNALKLAWTHHAYLREFTEELRKTVADKQLAIDGVSIGSETLKVANAHSIEVQRFLDAARVLVRSDLGAASLPLATKAVTAASSEVPQIHALREEISQLLDAMPAAETLQALTKAVHTVWAHHAAVNALISDPAFVDATLSAAGAGLDLAYTKKDAVTTLVAALDGVLLKEALAEQAMSLTTKGLEKAAGSDVRLTLTLTRLNALLATSTTEDTFELAERGAALVWENSGALLTLLDSGKDRLHDAGQALVTAGNGAVATSYVLAGSESVTGNPPVSYPSPPETFDTVNIAMLVGNAEVLLRQVSQAVNAVTSRLRSLQVPNGVQGVGESLTLGSSPGPVFRVYERYEVTQHSPLAGMASGPATTIINGLQTDVAAFQTDIVSHGQDTFDKGIELIRTGEAMKQLADGI